MRQPLQLKPIRGRQLNRLREMSPLWELAQEGVDLKSVVWSP